MTVDLENEDSSPESGGEFSCAAAAARGIWLFNQHRYFEAHEALEVIWLREYGARKTFLHGLIQVAAAFHHFSHANLPGFRSLMAKGSQKLECCADEIYAGYGVDRKQLDEELSAWRRYIARAESDAGSAPPPLPRIVGAT